MSHYDENRLSLGVERLEDRLMMAGDLGLESHIIDDGRAGQVTIANNFEELRAQADAGMRSQRQMKSRVNLIFAEAEEGDSKSCVKNGQPMGLWTEVKSVQSGHVLN